MKKVGIQVYNFSNYLKGGYAHGGGAVVVLKIIQTLAKNSDIDLYVFTKVPYELEMENIKIINGLNIKKDIEDFAKKENIELMLAENSQNIPSLIFLHAHSTIFKTKRLPFILRPIKYLFNQNELKYEFKYYNTIKNEKNCNIFIAPSKKMKQDYQETFNIPENKIKLAYFGCDQVFETLPEIEKKEKLTFGIVAGSSLNKGGYLTLLVLGLLKLTGYDFNLKIILKRPQKDLLANFLINILNLKKNVEKLSKFKDMSKFYPQIDCLLLASKNEAFGLVVTEAMTYGKPCLVSETAGAAEIIDGTNGYTFKRTISGYLKELKRIINLYNNNFEEFKTLAQRAFDDSKKYTWEQYLENIGVTK